jgi:hypothetical protein
MSVPRRHTLTSSTNAANHTTIHFSNTSKSLKPISGENENNDLQSYQEELSRELAKHQHTCVEDCGRTATVDCTICATSFCETCFNRVHEKSVALSRHTSVPIGHSKFMSRCRIHPDQLEDFFCLNCLKKICAKCSFTPEHRGHNATFLEEYSNGIDVMEQIGRIDGNFKKMDEISGRLANLRHECTKFEKETVSKITEEWDRVIDIATNCKKEMLDSFHTGQAEKSKQLL